MVSMLFPTWAYAQTSAYDELIIQAREGDRQPLLQYLAVREKQTQLTAGEIADWLQVSSWANNDVETLAVWDRYRHSMAIPRWPSGKPFCKMNPAIATPAPAG